MQERHRTHITRDRMLRAGISGTLLAALVGAVVPTAAPAGAVGVSTCDAPAAVAVPQPTLAQMQAAGLDELPVADDAARVDLVAGPFTDPTVVDNPLFPIADLTSAVLNGHVDGKPFRTETTLLPTTRIIEWTDGQCVEVLVSQYTAYLGGRIEEVALDFYAQADDGSVWYFGEDVFNYGRDGTISDTDGTWLAGKEGPAAMIMPADPQVGDVNRPENIPGLVFEEVTAKLIDQTADGPSGPISGVFIGQELHDDGSFSDKVFAPGYGEFLSAHEGDVEALALAVPVDAVDGGVPAALDDLMSAASRIMSSPLRSDGDWRRASRATRAAYDAWSVFTQGQVPPRLIPPVERGLARLDHAVQARERASTHSVAIDVAYAGLDLELRYLPAPTIDLERFELWARRVTVHAVGGSLTGVTGDLATMEWIRDRFVHTLDPVVVTSIDAGLGELRNAVVDDDLDTAAAVGRSLRRLVADLG